MILYLVPVGVNAEGSTELGKLERGSKELMVVECPGSTVSPWVGCGEPGSGVSGWRCLLGLAVGSLVVECPVVGVSLAVVGL